MSGFSLKLLAMVTMTLDHFGVVFLPETAAAYWLCRGVGRLAFPLYAFLVAQGCAKTRSRGRYQLRLLAFALLSELPFDLCFRGGPELGHQNVFFTLAAGALAIQLSEAPGLSPGWRKAGPLLLCLGCFLLGTDYGGFGALWVFAFYLARDSRPQTALTAAVCNLPLVLVSSPIQLLGAAALGPIALYNGRRGLQNRWVNWFFYLYYPLHLFCFWLVKLALGSPA